MKSQSEQAIHRGEPVTLPLNIFWNIIFSGSIVVFSLTTIMIVRKQPVVMYNYYHYGDGTVTCIANFFQI